MDDDNVQIYSTLKVPYVKGKPIKKRIQTEKRKMQNRESQRKYRENIKARLNTLEREADVSRAQDMTSILNGKIPGSVPFLNPPAQEMDYSMFGSEFIVPVVNSTFDFENEVLGADLSQTDFSSPFDIDFLYQDDQLGKFPQGFSVNETPEDTFQSFGNADLGFPVESDVPSESTSSYQSTISAATSTSEGRELESHFPEEEDESESSLQLYSQRKPAKKHQSGTPSQESATDLIRLLRLNNNNENLSVLRSAIARGYNVRDVFLAGLSALDDRDILSKIPLPDLKKNTLKLVRTSTLRAYLSVASCLQIPIKELYRPTCPSPFYNPSAPTSPNQDQAITSSYTTSIPHDLLPTPLQISTPHHPWLDLIPFPTFRERVLSLLSMHPPMIDLLELKGDIFMSDGIFCWRSEEKGGVGQPWEARNWEAEKWFLRKWWMLAGGEGGDMWKQTEWWRGVRGMGGVKMGWGAE